MKTNRPTHNKASKAVAIKEQNGRSKGSQDQTGRLLQSAGDES